MITCSNRLTPNEGRGAHNKGQVTEEPCDGKLSRTVLKGRREVAISPADPNRQMLNWLSQLAPVITHRGWQRDGNGTSQLRQWLGLAKDKKNKNQQTPATHAVDGVTLAAFEFIQWREWHSDHAKHGSWCGDVQITPAPFAIIRRPPISRRQLHLCVPSKGGKRRKYGGTVTRHGFRKGDKVIAEKAGKTYIGWCSGDTKTQVSVSDKNWKRLGQFSAKKVQLLQRSTGLIVVPSTGLSNLTASSGAV